MAVKRPDIYEHNNPDNAFVDSNFVRGGIRTSVNDISELYALSPKLDQLKEYSTSIFVKSENKFYTLIDINNVGNVNGWESIFTNGSKTESSTLQEVIDKSANGGTYVFASFPSGNEIEDDGSGLTFKGDIVILSDNQQEFIQVTSSGTIIKLEGGTGNNGDFLVNVDGNGRVGWRKLLDDTVISLAKFWSSQKISDELDTKVDKETGKGLSQENYTTAEKNKLAGLESSKWRGSYPSMALLLADLPEGSASTSWNINNEGGFYVDLDEGVEKDVMRYIWDTSDKKWVEGGSGTPLTGAQIKQMYEAQPDTNAFTDSLKSWLQGMSAQFTTVLKNSYDSAVSWISTNGQNVLDHINLPHAPADAQKNVKSDWDATTGDSEILNKPTNVSEFINDGNTLSPYATLADIYKSNALLSYGITQVLGYSYNVWADRYIINNVLYTTRIEDTVTLDPAHPTLDRFDGIMIKVVSGGPNEIIVKTGIPSENPISPNVNANDELLIRFILVKAGTTEPDIDTDQIYNENLGSPNEWNVAISGLVNPDNTEHASKGSKSIKFSQDSGLSDITFTPSVPVNLNDFQELLLDVRAVDDHNLYNIDINGVPIGSLYPHIKGYLPDGNWHTISYSKNEILTLLEQGGYDNANILSIKLWHDNLQ